MRLKIFISILLAGGTLALYWPASHFDRLFYDDLLFVNDPYVATGLNWHSLQWAMSAIVVSNWHPVTLLSFLCMHQFFGTNPGAEHLANVIFHAANTALLFLVLMEMTGMLWRSAVVSAIFAWHPLRLESVAWIAERKDVLFMFFMLLSLWCYARYAKYASEKSGKSPAKKDQGRRAERLWYAGALVFFALSFMSKAMVVTLPFLLLLLDFWPLRRFNVSPPQPSNPSNVRRLVIEKIPFFALAVVFSALTFWIQKQHQAVQSLGRLGLAPRLENVTLSYVYYLGHFVWPAKLSIFYEFPRSFDTVEVLLSGLLLLAVSALCILQIQRRPYLALGWFWFLGTMVPVIGVVQIGIDAMADRYTYLPLIGPAISLVWLAGEWGRTRSIRIFLTATTAVILAACAISTRVQLAFWQNTVTLFDRAIEVAPDYEYPHFPLAFGLEDQKRPQEAATQFQFSLAMKLPALYSGPKDYEHIHLVSDLNLADLLGQMGYKQQSDEYIEAALKVDPNSSEAKIAMNNLAWSLATSADARVRNGKWAVELGERACRLTDYKVTIYIGTLAAAYAEAGRFDDAIATAQKAIANAQQQGEGVLVQRNQELLQLYLAHQAYHGGQNDVWTVTPTLP